MASQSYYATQVLLDAPNAYWRLAETSGNFADLSGNGLSGTLGSAASAVLDSFTGADQNPLARANWTNVLVSGDNNVKLLSNQLASVAGSSSAYWTGSSFGPDCEVFATVPVKPAVGQAVILFARMSNPGAAGLTGYRIRLLAGATDTINIQRHDAAATVVTLSSVGGLTFTAGDKLRLRCSGSTITAWQYVAATSTWTLISTVTDATYGTPGSTGVRFSDTTARLDDFGAGQFATGSFERGSAGALADGNAALKLDGASYVSVADIAQLDLGDVLTLECWIKRQTPIGNAQVIISKGVNAYRLQINTSGSVSFFKEGAANSLCTSNINITDTTTWHHIVATKNGATIKLYIDSVDVTTAVLNATLSDTATALSIGQRFDGVLHFVGSLDEVAIYPTALSAARVLAHYNAGVTSALTYISEIAFTTDPDATPSYTDVTSKLEEIPEIKRGRQTELDRIETGTARDARYANEDRRFEPEYASSPYYPNVVPERKIRHSVVYKGIQYGLFTGFIEAFQPEWEMPDTSTVNIPAVDGFEPLKQKITATYPQQLSSERISAVLDSAGWSATDRAISTGQSTVPPATLTDTPAIQHILDIAEGSERGLFFIDAFGKATFYDRHHFYKVPYSTPVATFGDAALELAYEELVPTFDNLLLANDIRLTREGGAQQIATDATSIARYRRRPQVEEGLLLVNDNEALAQAQYRLALYKDPHLRFDQITVDARALSNSDVDPWPIVLGLELGDRVTVKKTPPGGGARISKDCLVQGVGHTIGPSTAWTTTFQLAPAETIAFIIFDNATYGKFDAGNKFAY